MAGRFIWSSTSDVVGRKNIYRLYLGVGALLYLVLLTLGPASTPLFVVAAMVILSFYGGGFATIPAYLRDLFGTYQVGAIHGRLLTAWSVAGVLGPLIVNAIADAGKKAGHTGPDLYATSFYIMISLLVVGFVANELVRPVDPKFHEPRAEETTEESSPEPEEATDDEPKAAEVAEVVAAEPEAADEATAAPVVAELVTDQPKTEDDAADEATVAKWNEAEAADVAETAEKAEESEGVVRK
jgi:MFS family permease